MHICMHALNEAVEEEGVYCACFSAWLSLLLLSLDSALDDFSAGVVACSFCG